MIVCQKDEGKTRAHSIRLLVVLGAVVGSDCTSAGIQPS